jgi:hypothetical protein
MSGAKIIQALEEATRGKLGRVWIDGVCWAPAQCPQPIETAPNKRHFLGWDAPGRFWVIWSAKNFHWSLQADAPPGISVLGEIAEVTTHWLSYPEPPEGI